MLQNRAHVDVPFSSAAIEIGDFVINTIERTATVLGQKLRLTFAEYVLVFVTNRLQRCVTPRTVLATNRTDYNQHYAEFLKALSSLRRKLERLAGGSLSPNLAMGYLQIRAVVFVRGVALACLLRSLDSSL